MLLTEADLSHAESMIFGGLVQTVDADQACSDSDFETLEIYRNWKEQGFARHGAGTRAPSMPRSQRQFDGDNWHEYCESLRG